MRIMHYMYTKARSVKLEWCEIRGNLFEKGKKYTYTLDMDKIRLFPVHTEWGISIFKSFWLYIILVSIESTLQLSDPNIFADPVDYTS